MDRKLNSDEIESINKFVSVQGIHYYDLIQELSDHIATEIEESSKSNIQEALVQVSKKFSSEDLSNILSHRT